MADPYLIYINTNEINDLYTKGTQPDTLIDSIYITARGKEISKIKFDSILSIELPGPPQNLFKNIKEHPDLGGFDISDSIKIVDDVFIEMIKNGKMTGELSYCGDYYRTKNKVRYEDSFFLFVDRNFDLIGFYEKQVMSYKYSANCSLKKGWNLIYVYVKIDYDEQKTVNLFFVTSPVSNFSWKCSWLW